MLLRSSQAKFLVPAVLFAAVAAIGSSAAGCLEDETFGCHDCGEGGSFGTHTAFDGSGASGGGTTTTTDQGGAGGSAGGSGGSGGAAPVCDPAVETCPCDGSGKCDGGLDCVGGLCIDGCEFTYQCGTKRTCVDGGCVTSCMSPVYCAAGYTCDAGLCVVETMNPQCGPQMPCDGIDVSCEDDGICRQKCSATADCEAGKVCDFPSGTCIDDPSASRACNDMMPCTGAGQDCGPDGWCHYPCATAADCQLVNVFYTDCKMGICMTHDEAHPECDIANPCPMGKHCVSNHCQ